MTPRRFFAIAIAIVIAVLAGAAAWAQEQEGRTIGVTVPGVPADYAPPSSTADDDTAGAAARLAASFASELAGILRLASEDPVVRLDFLLPEVDLPSAALYYERNAIDRAVFGRISPNTLLLAATIWRAGGSTAELEFSARDFTVEEAALEVASAVMGEPLATGWLEVDGAGSLEAFAVFADGNLLGRNERRVRLLEGSYRVTVTVPGVLGDQPVEAFDVDIRGGETERIALARPEQSTAADRTASAVEPAPDARDADAATGAVRVESVPPGASVYLDDRLLGTTPLERLGVPAGRYELRLEAPGFRTQVAAIDVEPDRPASLVADLDVNPDDPRVAALLTPPVQGSVAGISSLLLKATMFSIHLGTSMTTHLTMMVYGSLLYAVDLAVLASSMPAHALARAPVRTTVLAGTSTLGVAGMIVAGRLSQDAEVEAALPDWLPRLDTLAMLSAGLLIGGAHLYDMLGGPGAVEQRNRSVLESIEATGEIPEQEAIEPRRFAVEALGGSIARGLYLIPLREHRARAEVGAGVQVERFDPLGVGAHVLGRAVMRPWTAPRAVPNLEGHVEAVVETDFAGVGAGVGFGVGTWFRFRSFELFWRHTTRYSLPARSWVVLVGVGGAF